MHTQFKPGQSGNPKGRAKGTRNLKTDLQEELQKEVKVTEGKSQTVVSKQRAMVMSLANRALQGDVRAIDLMTNLLRQLLPQEDANEEARSLPKDDREILNAFVKRLRSDDT
jgi:hypothetical protein